MARSVVVSKLKNFAKVSLVGLALVACRPEPAPAPRVASGTPAGASARATRVAPPAPSPEASAPGKPLLPPKVPSVTVVAKIVRFPRERFGQKIDPGTLRFPSVRADGHPEIERAINAALGVPGFPKGPIDHYGADWLDELDFHVNHNADGVLDLTLEVSGSGAYPSVMTEHHVFDLSTGKRLEVSDLFSPSRQTELAARLDERLQKELENARARKIPGLPADCPLEMYEGSFAVADLSSFTFGANGVSFHHGYDFPHAFLACEPPGVFELGYRELERYVVSDGPLARLAR